MSHPLRQPQGIEDVLLYRLNRLLSIGGAPVIRLCEGRYGITRREWRIIASLRPGVSLLSSELAEHAQLDRARTSRGVSSLVAKGLLDRQAVPGDGRLARICLTDQGRALYESLFPQVQALHAQLVQSLSDSSLVLLDEALRRLQAEAERLALPDLPKADRRRGRRTTPRPQPPT